MNHHFDIDFATDYGIEAAIILNNLLFWCKKNEANEKHYHHKRTWSYNTIEAFYRLFPYMTKYAIRKALSDLENNGFIVVNNFNKIPYDRTKWYAVTEKAIAEIDNSNYRNRKMDLKKSKNGFKEIETPIPDVKPNGKTSDVKTTTSRNKKNDSGNRKRTKESLPVSYEQIISSWNNISSESNSNIPALRKLTEARKEKIRTRNKSMLLSAEDWQTVFDEIKSSSFLKGKNDKGWSVTFDWLVKSDANFTKVLEGNYQDKAKTSKHKNRTGAAVGKYDNIGITVEVDDDGNWIEVPKDKQTIGDKDE